MRALVAVAVLATAGCYAIVEPGHRGLLFNPRYGGLQHEVLGPGRHKVGLWGRIEDFDVTYSTGRETLHAEIAEGAADVRVAIIYRPIISELYQLDSEIGPNYYNEVIAPEFRTAARATLAHHAYRDLFEKSEHVEDEIEQEVRRRTQGRHVEIASVTVEEVAALPTDVATRNKFLQEREALLRKELQAKEALLRRQLQDVESARLRLEKDHEP
jgi:hypothetical protein